MSKPFGLVTSKDLRDPIDVRHPRPTRDLRVGQRVRLNAEGKAAYRLRMSSRIGIVVAFTTYPSARAVLWEGRNSAEAVNVGYLDLAEGDD